MDFSEALQMHASEMSSEAKRIQNFTDKRFNLKSAQYENSLKAILKIH